MTPLNLTEAQEPVFEPVPAGTYHLEVVKCNVEAMTKDGPSLPAGTEFYNVQYRITDELAEDGETEVENRRVFNRYYIAPEGHPKKGFMDGLLLGWFLALGFDEADIRSGEFDPDDDIVGRECNGRVTVEEYDGKERNNLKQVLPFE